MRRITLLLATVLLIGLAACTPEQVALFHTLSPEDQGKVVAELQRQQAQRPTDCYTAMEQVFPAHTWGWGRSIIKRESRNDPRAQNARSSAAGCWQTISLHRGRYSKLGYSWERDRYNALANTRVAYDLYLEAGTSPWRVR